MATFRPAYRIRVYKPYPNEAQVLVPAAGAPHNDPLQYATIEGVAGYKPYLDIPTGRPGRLDALTTRTDVGELTFRSLDVRYPTPGQGSNAVRHFTAYVGDANGVEQLKGLKVEADFSADGGVTWALAATHRVSRVALDEPQWFEIGTRDTSAQLASMRCFVGRPHSSLSYAAPAQLWPAGLYQAYGFWAAGNRITAKIDASGISVTVDAGQLELADNLISRTLAERLLLRPFASPAQVALGISGESIRVRLKRLDTSAEGEFVPQRPRIRRRRDNHWAVERLDLVALPTTDPNYLAVPPASTAVSLRIISTGTPSPVAPIFVNDQHPVQVWKDLLDGKYGRLNADGSAVRTFPYDSSTFTTFIADTTLGVLRATIEKSNDLHEWIERHVLKPFRLGYRINAAGAVVPIDLRPPTSLSAYGTLTDAHLREGGVPHWLTEESSALTQLDFTYYLERQVAAEDYERDPTEFPDITPGRLSVAPVRIVRPNVGRRELPERVYEVDSRGDRAAEGEVREGLDRRVWIERRIRGHLEHVANQFGPGAMEASVPAKRSAFVDGIEVGMWLLVELSMLPDPATNKRGGQRLMRVEEKFARPDGLEVDLTLLDSGLSTTATAPTIGTLAQQAGNTRHGIDVPVTLNAQGQPVRLEIAVTDTSVGTAPAATSSLWTFAALVTATGTETIRNLPSGKRVWVRGRSETSAPLQQPSAWTFSTGTDYVDTAAVTAPTGLAASGITSSTALLTWTNGDATLPVELLYVTPSSGTPALVFTLLAGSNRNTLYQLDANVSHKVQVRHPDGLGGYSAVSETTFNTTTTPPVSAAAPAVAVLVGIP